MKRIPFYTLLGLLAICSCACGGEDPSIDPGTKPGPDETEGATLWTTTFDKSRRFEQSTVKFDQSSPKSPNAVRFTDETFQTVDGFGLAITHASCFNLLRMSQEDRTQLLTELFSPTAGAGSSLIRVCIGGSDFSVDHEYTWCDEEGMANFAIHEDEFKYLFPILDEIYKINPNVQIIGSPWSCPTWMKMTLDGSGAPMPSWTSGRLNPKYYADYADYFVKWIQEMQKRGYKVKYVTLQNEPLNKGNSMSLYMPWQDQRDFLKVVGPAFRKAGLKTEILLFDHNYNYDGISDQREYPLKIYADPEAAQYAAGSAWHNYLGSVSELDKIQKAAPDKGIWFTEASIGGWNYDEKGFGAQFQEDFREIVMGTLKRGCKGITLWNMMLDNESKPYRKGGCSNCYGAVSIDNSTYSFKTLDRKSHWYDVIHPSVVIKPGAVRIGTEGRTAANVTYLAFRNPDKSYAVLILNEGSTAEPFVFASGNHTVSITAPGKSVISAIWKD